MGVTSIICRVKLAVHASRKRRPGVKAGKPLTVPRNIPAINIGNHDIASWNGERNPILGVGPAELGETSDSATDRIESGRQRQCSWSSLIVGQVARNGLLIEIVAWAMAVASKTQMAAENKVLVTGV